ncbi:MAG: hypothetical protein WBD66_01240 [Candidatus Acidiferrales bacterium]
MQAPKLVFALIFCASAIVLPAALPAQGVHPTPQPGSVPQSDPSPAHRTSQSQATSASGPEMIQLDVPAGTPLQIAIERESRLGKPGQSLRGRVVEPVYAFDKLVIPVGTQVSGHVMRINPVSTGKRTAAALDADFTPSRNFEVAFDEIVFADGTRIPLDAAVTPGSGQVIRLVTAANDPSQKKSAKDVASEKARQAKDQAIQDWNTAMKQVRQPGKIHTIERVAIAQLPVHPQYISAGAVYFAELKEPLHFGSEPLTPERAASIGVPPPMDSFVRARLVTPLNSATARIGDDVEAVVTQPVFDGDRLIFPQGTRLKGTVVQAQAAHKPARNGQLRIVFHEMVLASGLEEKIQASLEAVQAAQSADMNLDSEGGAHAGSPPSRFLRTGFSLVLAAASAGVGGDTLGDAPERAAGGAGGYKLIGIALGLTVHSQPFGTVMGAIGASRSIYTNFVARGRDVVFPRNTAMEIGISAPHAGVPAIPALPPAQQN